jgi:MT0933-like antitoxin protein
MGILDVFKHKAKDLTGQAGGAATAVKDRAGDLAGPAGEAVNGAKHKMSEGLGSAAQFANAKTNRKYTQQIDGAVDKAQNLLGGSPRPGAPGQDATGKAHNTQQKPNGSSTGNADNADDATDKLPRI